MKRKKYPSSGDSSFQTTRRHFEVRKRQRKLTSQIPTQGLSVHPPTMRHHRTLRLILIVIIGSVTCASAGPFASLLRRGESSSPQDEYTLLSSPKHSVILRAPRNIGNFFRRMLGKTDRPSVQLPASLAAVSINSLRVLISFSECHSKSHIADISFSHHHHHLLTIIESFDHFPMTCRHTHRQHPHTIQRMHQHSSFLNQVPFRLLVSTHLPTRWQHPWDHLLQHRHHIPHPEVDPVQTSMPSWTPLFDQQDWLHRVACLRIRRQQHHPSPTRVSLLPFRGSDSIPSRSTSPPTLRGQVQGSTFRT